MKKKLLIVLCSAFFISEGFCQVKNVPESTIYTDDVNVYADPARKIIKVVYSTSIRSDVSFKVLNGSGEIIYSENEKGLKGNFNKLIDLGSYPGGTYNVVVESAYMKQEEQVTFN